MNFSSKHHKLKSKIGLPPGHVVYTGQSPDKKVEIKIKCFSSEGIDEISSLDELTHLETNKFITWVNILGIHDENEIARIGQKFCIHKMFLEDIANIHQRPKIDRQEKTLFCSLKYLVFEKEHTRLVPRHLCLLLTSDTIISLIDGQDDIFTLINKRLEQPDSRLRALNDASFFFYTLLDLIVDQYLEVVDQLGAQIDELEVQIEENTNKEQMRAVYQLNKCMAKFLKFTSPLRTHITDLKKNPPPYFSNNMDIYLRDLEDHLQRVVEESKYFQERVNYCENLYFSILNLRTNDVMKYLAAISTIFLPLSFVAGIYGMNFDYMPELQYSWGYPLSLCAMASIAFLIIAVLKRKKWL